LISSDDAASVHEIKQKGALGLAFLGDAVYELLVRDYIITHSNAHPSQLHRDAVSYVCANAQQKALESITSVLTEDELAAVKRAKNSSKMSIPKNSEPKDYRAATGLEALFGYLYLAGQGDRISELFEIIISSSDSNKDAE